MQLEVVENNGPWNVIDSSGAVVQTFPTNAQAWRFVDRRSHSENKSAWIMSKIGVDQREGPKPQASAGT